MRVLFLVADPEQVSTRFRVRQYLPYLEARGIAATIADLRLTARQRRRLLATAGRYDRVVVHRAFLSRREIRLLGRVAPPFVYDFDDAIMFRDSAARRHESWQRRWRFARMARSAGHVVAGNDYLAEWAVRHQRRVTVIPTPIDVERYPNQAEIGREPIVGWMGTRINLMYLRRLAGPLARLAQQHPALRVKLVSDGSFALPGVPLVAKRWSAADELNDLRSFRVGIMPLPDDPWTRGKCGVKLLQYMAAGVPAVCSPVGANAEIVQDGVNGYFARGDDEWIGRIGELLEDPARCRALAAAARRTVEERYSVAAQLDRLVAVLQAPVRHGGTPSAVSSGLREP